MPTLNANIPYIECYVRNAFLYNDWTNTQMTQCYVFGVKAILNRALGFHCQLDDGSVFWSLPIGAFVQSESFDLLSPDENERLSLLQWWDCQSQDIAITVFSYLQNYEVDCRNRKGEWMRGHYLFTIDDYYADNNALPVGYAIDPDSKCYHVIALDNGNYCAYPNNYLRWHNLNHVQPYDLNNPPKYKAAQFYMCCEYIPNTTNDTPTQSADQCKDTFGLGLGDSGDRLRPVDEQLLGGASVPDWPNQTL